MGGIETQAEMQGNNEGGEVIDPGQDYFLNLKYWSIYILGLNL